MLLLLLELHGIPVEFRSFKPAKYDAHCHAFMGQQEVNVKNGMEWNPVSDQPAVGNKIGVQC
ncbi:hypothetical protein BUE93_20760 [Chromobacterium amazonense]|uniref:Uncharacterized protein n=1 Tax=Chromobacterium amazonense TaxID=1382803 RepID=A0A2S9WZ07_9NEIS|nr:hypothetical protein BUE93_20760 [Chromobacterium amazonense]